MRGITDRPRVKCFPPDRWGLQFTLYAIRKITSSGLASGANNVSKVTGFPRSMAKVNDRYQVVRCALPDRPWGSLRTTLQVCAEAFDSRRHIHLERLVCAHPGVGDVDVTIAGLPR